MPPGDLEALEGAIHPGTAAVLIETIQGEGGVLPLSEHYLTGLRRLCSERQVLLIVDDVQAGVGRTGTWFSWQQLGFEPDIATTAKALASGLPIGVCLATAAVAAVFRPGDHATTFGGGPVVCAAALATLSAIEDDGLLTNARERGDQFAHLLSRLPGVRDVRGRGLLLAAVLEEPAADHAVLAALDEGLVVNNVRPDAVRFTPPLSISAAEVEEAVQRFERALRSIKPSI